MNLTEKAVAALKLPAGKSDVIYFDDKVPGLGARFRKASPPTWIFQFKIGSLNQRMTLGKVSAMKAGAARAIAEKYYADVKAGHNPQAEKRVRTAQAANTFGELVRQYLEFKKSRLRPRSFVEVTRHLNVYAKPLHGLPVAAIDKVVIGGLIKKVASSKGTKGKMGDGIVTANRVRASLSALFTWAMKETDFAAANPVVNTHKAGNEKSRTRVLKDAEIKIIWNALGDDDYGAIVRLLLLTAQRLNEIAGLRWEEIEFDRNRIVLPGARTKNGRAHHVPMSGTVRQLLEDQQAKRAEGQELVFVRGERAFSGWTHGRKVLDERIEQATNGTTLPHWTPHDLRRTAATRMAEDLQVQPHVIEAILNHVSGHKAGIVAVYNLATYAAEKEAALTLWASHVAAIVEGGKSNVTSLHRAG